MAPNLCHNFRFQSKRVDLYRRLDGRKLPAERKRSRHWLGAAQSSQPRRVKLKRHLSSVVLVQDPLLSDKLSIRQKIVAPKTNFLIGDLKCKKL